jgi:hypothetical protein
MGTTGQGNQIVKRRCVHYVCSKRQCVRVFLCDYLDDLRFVGFMTPISQNSLAKNALFGVAGNTQP